MRINVEEIVRINGRLEDIKDELGSSLAGVNEELTSISGNIKSDGLVNSNNLIHENITTLTQKLNTNLDALIAFLGSQMEKYKVTNEAALRELQSLIQLLEGVYDKNGNIINSFQSVSEKTKVDSAYEEIVKEVPIGDQSAYASGESNIGTLQNKLGSSETIWNNLETCYTFFKGKGLTDEQIAGILGNITQESGFNATIKNPTSTATGLFQWLQGRWPSDWSVEGQLNHAWNEFSSTRYGGKGLTKMQQTTTVADATQSFAYWFEGFGSSGSELTRRTNYANACYYYIKNLQK